MKNWPRNLKIPGMVVGLTAGIVFAVTTQTRAENALTTITHIDGHQVSGYSMTWDNSQVLLAIDGGQQKFDVDDLMSISFAAKPVLRNNEITVFLADGSHIFADLLDSADDAIIIRSSWGQTITLSFEALAGLKFTISEDYIAADRLFLDALDKPLPGHDILITRSKDTPKVMRGRLSSLQATDGHFIYSDRSRTFKNEKMYGIVFAGLPQRNHRVVQRVHLTHGAYLVGQILHADQQQILISTEHAGQLKVPIAYVRRITCASSRIIYLSDLSPLNEHVQGRIHRPWPIRRDRAVSMSPLRLGGVEYEKGLGVHSRTLISFDVNQSFERFVSTIGLDDSVAPLGVVVFQVLGDENTLFDSHKMYGSDQPKLINVDISSVDVLTLLVDYGDDLDLADHADWASARIIKKPSHLETGINTQ